MNAIKLSSDVQDKLIRKMGKAWIKENIDKNNIVLHNKITKMDWATGKIIPCDPMMSFGKDMTVVPIELVPIVNSCMRQLATKQQLPRYIEDVLCAAGFTTRKVQDND